MAFEELLQLLSKWEALAAKQHDAMSLIMLGTAEAFEAEDEVTSGDPEWKAIAARAEAGALQVLGNAAASADMSTRMAAEYAAKPGGEEVAEAYTRIAASEAALGARTEDFAALMREAGAVTVSDPDVTGRRCRKPNARYFGPEWSN